MFCGLWRRVPTFRNTVDLLNLETRGSTFLRNAGNYSVNGTAQRLRRPGRQYKMYFLCSTSFPTSSSACCKAMCDANLCKLTSWVSDPVEKLVVVELAKLQACHGVRDFITELKTASHCSLSWARLIHSTSVIFIWDPLCGSDGFTPAFDCRDPT